MDGTSGTQRLAELGESDRCTTDILVVDDDADCREVVAVLLECEGHGVTTACDGEEALGLLRSRPVPNAVVLDLMMPRVNGAEVVRAMRADPRLRRVPVVLVSAAPRSAWASLEADPLLAVCGKPLHVEKFLVAVTAAVGSVRSSFARLR